MCTGVRCTGGTTHWDRQLVGSALTSLFCNICDLIITIRGSIITHYDEKLRFSVFAFTINYWIAFHYDTEGIFCLLALGVARKGCQ